MKILLTGASGYIGQRLLPVLLENGHEVVCCVRDIRRFNIDKYGSPTVTAIEVDFLKMETLANIPENIDVAYYLIHSMSTSVADFDNLERISACNFVARISKTNARQVIYLSGIVNGENLSKHLQSRKNVEDILASGAIPLTTLRAGIIVGSGSASFEIIRDLVEKMPMMIAPLWLRTKCQPIAIRNVLEFLCKVQFHPQTFNKSFDIGGNEILTYKEMLQKFAKVRGIKIHIFTVFFITPKISSYWLYFLTSTSNALAKNLVNSMKVEVICRNNDLAEMMNIKPIDYETAIKLAFGKIEQNQIVSSWKDALTSNILLAGISKHMQVPKFGCFRDIRKRKTDDVEKTLFRIWSIGGDTGWYHADWLWGLRGLIDKLQGGVGTRRGRKNQHEIFPGESLDFWRVLIADKKEKRLLLYAEMKLPGEAWLEFKIENNILKQTATFRPLGIPGRVYWYSVLPFHGYIFKGMIKKITE